jgi:hypothetical protein
LLADRERILGVEHPSTLTTRNQLGAAYRDGGRIEDAIATLEPVVADLERILASAHRDTLRT